MCYSGGTPGIAHRVPLPQTALSGWQRHVASYTLCYHLRPPGTDSAALDVLYFNGNIHVMLFHRFHQSHQMNRLEQELQRSRADVININFNKVIHSGLDEGVDGDAISLYMRVSQPVASALNSSTKLLVFATSAGSVIQGGNMLFAKSPLAAIALTKMQATVDAIPP